MDNQQSIPSLRFSEFSEEWEIKKLGFISEIIMGQSPDGDSYNLSGIGTPLINGPVEFSEKYPVKVKWTSKPTKYCQDKDILFCVRGSTTGKMNIANDIYCIGRGVAAIRANQKSTSEFIELLLIKNLGSILTLTTGSTFFNIDSKSLKEYQFSIPSLPEQQKIASFLTSVDTKLTQLKQKKILLEQYKKGVMQKIFSREIRFKDDEGKEFPEWEVRTLGDLGTFQTSSIDKLSVAGEKEVYLVNYMNVYRHESISNTNKKDLMIVTAKDSQIENNNLKRGDILFTPSSETPDDIGHSVVIFEDLFGCVYSYHLMRFRPLVEIDLLYSHYFCNIPKVLSQLTKLSTGSTRFTISVKSFSSIIIDLPCLSEQTKIANFLTSLDEKINQCSTQIEKTEQWKKGLLQQMFV